MSSQHQTMVSHGFTRKSVTGFMCDEMGLKRTVLAGQCGACSPAPLELHPVQLCTGSAMGKQADSTLHTHELIYSNGTSL
eukprot:6213255-Pleurochrysis_carterae.AAC.1